MINKENFNLLLQEISQIENKITEVKILNQFDKANEYDEMLESIKIKASKIVLDNENKSEKFDDISLNVLSELIILNSEIDYYILKTNNIIESASENRIDAEALKRIKNLWSTLEKYIESWDEESHNPIEEIEYNKHIAKLTLEIIVCQLQTEGVINFSKVFKYCKKDFLVNTIKETLFEGAKNELRDEIRKRMLINLAKNITKKDLYDYKLWQQILIIRNMRSRDDHIEIIGNIQDNRKYNIDENYKEKNKRTNQNLDVFYDESILNSIKKFFSNLNEFINQKRMNHTWLTSRGPAFKIDFEDYDFKYSREYLDKNTIRNAKKLTIATNGVAKYNFEKNSKWEKLEELEFLEKKNISSVNLSPDKTYGCIGNECFSDCTELKKISFGKVEMIGDRAFKNCTSLSDITFSKSLMNIGEDAFCGCTNLKKVEFKGDLKLYILERPQNILNCFKDTNLEEIVFANIESIFNYAITDCPNLKRIYASNVPGIEIPFKTCKYRIGRQDGIVSFVGEKSLNLWKKRNSTVRFFELTEEDKRKYKI